MTFVLKHFFVAKETLIMKEENICFFG